MCNMYFLLEVLQTHILCMPSLFSSSKQVEKRLDTVRGEFLLEGKQGEKSIPPIELEIYYSIKMKELYGKWWLPKSTEESTTTIRTTYSL